MLSTIQEVRRSIPDSAVGFFSIGQLFHGMDKLGGIYFVLFYAISGKCYVHILWSGVISFTIKSIYLTP